MMPFKFNIKTLNKHKKNKKHTSLIFMRFKNIVQNSFFNLTFTKIYLYFKYTSSNKKKKTNYESLFNSVTILASESKWEPKLES